MSLVKTLDILLSSPYPFPDKEKNLASLLDLTLLNREASKTALLSLYAQGQQAEVAALCVLPEHLALLPQGLRLATVMNFPEGSSSTERVLEAIQVISRQQGLQEIDYVFPYADYLQGKTRQAIDACAQVVNFCHRLGLTVKIILESGAFGNLEMLYQASREVIDSACDFIKSSTGKIAQGASPGTAAAMLAAIKDSGTNCGIKFSGGIRSRQQALQYLHLVHALFDRPPSAAWIRFGSSSLLN